MKRPSGIDLPGLRILKQQLYVYKNMMKQSIIFYFLTISSKINSNF